MTASWQPDSLTQHWNAQLSLRLENNGHKTIIRDLSHVGPVRVLRPYYPNNNGNVQIYLLHPPGALIGGDSVEFSIHATQNTNALITTPSAGKFNRALIGSVQTQKNHLLVEDGGCLEWFPQENIFFNAAQARCITEVHLLNNARFSGWDIFCLGRPAANELFSNGMIRTQFRILLNDSFILNEAMYFLLPQMQNAFEFATQNRTVCGLLCANEIKAAELPASVTQLLEENAAMVASTRIKDWIFIRYLGESTEKAKAIFIAIWSALKKSAWQQEFVPPRIWSH